jgi:PiT family inorganic phosphate transporter
MFDFFQSAVDNFGTSYFWDLSLLVWLLIALALTFDFLNGLHDAANSIATVVSTRVLSPRTAVLWAAFFNFVAFLVFPLNVAATIQKDVVDQALFHDMTQANLLIAATLIAACGWNLLTWYLALPTSSSHALIGGMVGAALALTGDISSLKFDGLTWIILFIVLAPLIGALLGLTIAVAVIWACHKMTPLRVDNLFRRGQLLSAAFFSLGHGGNDAQKTMGIILFLLIAASGNGAAFPTPTEVPTEVVLACHLAMGLGTMFGGWRIVKTMGQRIIRLRPIDGFCAETGAALTLAMTTIFKGIPISTTHTITGAIVGVGSLKRLSAVRWGVAGQVVWAWVLTIPGAALLAAVSVGLLRIAGSLVAPAIVLPVLDLMFID